VTKFVYRLRHEKEQAIVESVQTALHQPDDFTQIEEKEQAIVEVVKAAFYQPDKYTRVGHSTGGAIYSVTVYWPRCRGPVCVILLNNHDDF